MLINEELIKYALFRKHSQENHQNLNAILLKGATANRGFY